MKKLLLSLALMLSVFSLSAQKFTVTEKTTGNIVENGANFYVYGEGNAWGELLLELLVTANEDVNLIAERIELQVVEGTYNMICLDQCYAPSMSVTPAVPFAAGDTKDFSMHYQYENSFDDVVGQEQFIQYNLYEEGSHEMFVITVTFKYSANGISDNSIVEEFSNAYPTPAKDVVSFDYNFSSSANDAYVAIYSMTGQEVMRSAINDLQGKVSFNVSDLADGVYFYSLVVNGETVKSSKLVVRK